jgi:hypothetical protein
MVALTFFLFFFSFFWGRREVGGGFPSMHRELQARAPIFLCSNFCIVEKSIVEGDIFHGSGFRNYHRKA